MAKRAKSGFYWHVHHGILIEFCYDYNERATYIREQKAKHETKAQINTRRRLFKPVKGKLPEEFKKTLDAYEKAKDAHIKARDLDSWYSYVNIRDAINRAIIKNMPMLKALHKTECPDCPWDGKTIFP